MKTLISNLLNSKSLTFDINKIALTYTEGDTYYGISYNYMGTGLHIPVDQVNEEECNEEGIKIWKTWSYRN